MTMLDIKRTETIEKLVEVMLGPEFIREENALAAAELGALGAYEALPHLVKATLIDDNNLRVAALDSIGLLGLHTVVQDLMPFFKQEDLSVHVRHVGLLTLGELPCPEGLLILVPTLISEEEKWLKWSAAIALASFEEQYTEYIYPQIVDALLEAYQPHLDSLNPFRTQAELAFQRLCRYPTFKAYINSIIFTPTRNAIGKILQQPPHKMLNSRMRYEREPVEESALDVLRRNVQQSPERFAEMDPQRLGRLIMQ